MALKVLYAMMVLGCSGEDDVNGKSRAVPSLMVSKDKTLPGVSSLAGVGPGSLGEIGKFKMLQKEDQACPSGYADITTQEACIAVAASYFGLSTQPAVDVDDLPPYCFKYNGYVTFNTNKDAFDPDQDAQKICQVMHLCSKDLDYASEIITGPGTGSGPMTALALLCVGMTMTMLISYIVVRRRASELSEGLLAAPVGGEEESAAPYTQASP